MRSFGKLLVAIVVAVAVMSCDYSGDAPSSEGGLYDILNGADREASSTHWRTGDGRALALYEDESGVARNAFLSGVTDFWWTSNQPDELSVDYADEPIFFDTITAINGNIEVGKFSARVNGVVLEFKLMSGSL